MIAIVSGLNSPPIRRLKRTWDQINPRFMTMLGACEMTIDSNKNFSNYRSLLQRITPPCVPFVGMFDTYNPTQRISFLIFFCLFVGRAIPNNVNFHSRRRPKQRRNARQLPKTTKGGRGDRRNPEMAVKAI